jgi:spermidine synthase
MAGLASLFTREFFELAKAHLDDDGIFVQFTHSYQMDWPTFAMIGRTFSDVFPNAILVNTQPTTYGPDYLLIGMKGEKRLDAGVAERNLRYARQSKNMTILDHRLLYNLILSEDLQRLFGDGPIHTEDRPFLEFAAPRLLYINDPMIRQKISDGRWLSDTTREIVREQLADLDTRIDFAVFALSLYSPEFVFQNRLDLSSASADQRKRVSDLLVEYCSNNIVPDIFSLKDGDIRELCLSAQKETLKRRMAQASDRIPFVYRLGAVSSEEGKLEEAAGYFTEVLRSDPDHVEAHNALGNVLAEQGRYDEAIDHHLKAVELAPDNAVTYNNLGCTLSERGRVAEALEYYSKALRLNPGFVDAHYNMGKALVSQGKLDEAIDRFTAVVRIDPGYSEAHNNLGDVFLGQGNLDKAVFHYATAARIAPEDALAQNGLGSALAAQGKMGEAIQHLSKAVDLEPDFVKALNSLAWTLATGSDPKFRDGARAVMLARRACQLTDNRHPLLLDTLAAAFAESGEFDKAVQTAQMAIALARSAGRVEWARDIEKRLESYNRGLPFHTGS